MKQVSQILWVKTLEESDHQGTLIPHFIRERYKAEAPSWSAFHHRAESILRWMEQSKSDHPGQPSLSIGSWSSFFLFSLITLAIGLSLNLFGSGLDGSGLDRSSRNIHIFLNPFTGLWLWNFIVLPLQVLFLWIRRRPLGLPNLTLVHSILSGLKKWVPSGWVMRARFFREMSAVAPQAMRLRLSMFLHLGALLILAGAIFGLYIRGLLLNYTFSWESTFFSTPHRLQAILDVFFIPASMLTGGEIPRLDAMGTQSPGALWIHLFAAASFLYVGIPRFLLLIVNVALIRKQKAVLPAVPRHSYFMKLIQGGSYVFYTYGMKLEKSEKDALVKVLGLSGDLNWASIQWGEESPVEEQQYSRIFLLFHAAQTPEEEIQGRFLGRIKSEPVRLVLWNGKENFHQSESRLSLWEDMFRYAGFEEYLVFQENGTYQVEERTL